MHEESFTWFIVLISYPVRCVFISTYNFVQTVYKMALKNIYSQSNMIMPY